MKVSLLIYLSGHGRGREYGGGNVRGVKNDSVWSAGELQAANVAPAHVAIDWNTIRANKDKYDELKWKGETSYC